MEILELSLEYFSLVFAAAVGVIQAAAGHGGQNQLFFLKKNLHGYIFAGMTVIPAMAGFFTWNYRNPTGITEGTQQFYLFLLAAACAMVVSVLVTRIITWSADTRDKSGSRNEVKDLYRREKYQDDRSV